MVLQVTLKTLVYPSPDFTGGEDMDRWTDPHTLRRILAEHVRDQFSNLPDLEIARLISRVELVSLEQLDFEE
jgi:hypothetical protein